MQIIVLSSLLMLSCSAAHATSYYFSSSEGNDNRGRLQAQQAVTPWRSLQKLQEVFNTLHAGDSILFKRGDTFYGSLAVTASGNASASIVLCAYGSGKQPVISGFTTVKDWARTANNIWESALANTPDMVNMVLVNGAPEALGRYPNASAANGGYLTIEEASGSEAITGTRSPAANWTGAEVVIRKNHWVLDRNQISNISGKTIRYVSETSYGAAKNYGYFIQNHASTLDQACEWYFNKRTRRLGMYFMDTARFVVQASTIGQLVSIHQQRYIIFQDLQLEGANEYAFDISGSHHIQIKNTNILYTGNTAIHISQCEHVWIEQVTINHTNNIACDIGNTGHLTIIDNTISNTGTVAGSGKGNSGSYEALLLSGNNQVIERNTIINTGYIPITFNGNDIIIRNNFISRYGMVKDDGGGIYTWNNTGHAPQHWNRKIDGNILLDAVGAPDGTDDRRKWMHGIYIDDNADHVTITNNSIVHCSRYGIYIHNAHHLQIDSNTTFNNQSQIAFIHDHIAATIPIRNISFTNNINFSRTATQPVALFKSIKDDLLALGKLDANYYCRPLDEQTPIEASWKSGWSFFDVAEWQRFSRQEQQSKKTPVSIDSYRINRLHGVNKYPNGHFTDNINNLYTYAASGNSSVSWTRSNVLNGGALRVSFSKLSGERQHATVVIGIGHLKKGQQYILRYDVAGAAVPYIESYLRKSKAPYNDLSERKRTRVSSRPAKVELLFTATASDEEASIGLDIEEQATPLEIDNLQLYEANVSLTNPDDAFLFVYNNAASARAFVVDGEYIDVRAQSYARAITLPPFRSAVLIRKKQGPQPGVITSVKAFGDRKTK